MDYKWYEIVEGDDIQQGDILENCPVIILPSDLQFDQQETSSQPYDIPFEGRDVIIMSQTCDMIENREKVPEVLLCALWKKSDLKDGKMSTNSEWEGARKGQMPCFHVLNICNEEGFKRDFSVVDFRRVHSLPIGLTREIAKRLGRRIRLLSPYREQLSQSFARFFMRVGLPVDIPPFI